MLDWVDIISVHPYRLRPPESVRADYDRLQRLIRKHTARVLPIWSGEWGYTTADPGISEKTQAKYLSRMLVTNFAYGCAMSVWYDLRCDGTDPIKREHNFGMVNHDLTPRRAFRAARVVTALLDSSLKPLTKPPLSLVARKARKTAPEFAPKTAPKLAPKSTQEPALEPKPKPATEPAGEPVEIHGWRSKKGDIILAVWSRRVASDDFGGIPFDLVFEVNLSPFRAVIIDGLSGHVQRARIERKGHSYCLKNVRIRDYPLFIRLRTFY
jgi:hypothetical protein